MDFGIRKLGLAVDGKAAGVIGMHVGQNNGVNLVGPVAGGREMADELAGGGAEQGAGPRIDQQ
ncbi:hypothetical protein D9M70_537550 [compost metagenome]